MPRSNIQLGGQELKLDADADTSITVDTDDQIDIKIADADDFRFTANTFTVLSGSTLVNSGNAIQSNAGITIDNITIDGTEIDLSSGDLTLDVAGNIILNADGAYWKFEDGSVEIFQITSGSQNANLVSMVQDKDIRLQGYDGSSLITAVNLDMSDAGHATFNNGITLSDGDLTVASGHGIDFSATANSSGTMSNELLDDYEEGTIDISSLSYETSGGLTTHSGNQALNYTKVGRLVHINGNIHVNDANASGNQNGRLQIPLPFANPSGNTYRAVGQAGHYSHDESAVWLIEGGGSVATFRFAYQWDTPTISDNDTVVVNITYQVAS